MKGTIRILLGLFLVMGGVGGIETDTSGDIIPLAPLMIAILGLVIFAWGTVAAQEEA